MSEEIERNTNSDLITCSFYAISSVVDLDTGLMDKDEKEMVKNIISRSLRLIDACIRELYETEFED
jgi:hypothetical protein